MTLSPTSQVKILVSVLGNVHLMNNERVVVATAVEVLGSTFWYDEKGTHIESFWNYIDIPAIGEVQKIAVGRTDRTKFEVELLIERTKKKFNPDNYGVGKNDHLDFTMFLINYLTHNRVPSWIMEGRNNYVDLIQKYADITVNLILKESVNMATITPEQELFIRLSHVMDTTLLISSSLETISKFSSEIDVMLSKYIKDENEKIGMRYLISKLNEFQRAVDSGVNMDEMNNDEQELCYIGIKTLLKGFEEMGRIKKRFVIFDVLRGSLVLRPKIPDELYDGSFLNAIIALYKDRIFKSRACPVSLCLFLTNYIAFLGYKGVNMFDLSLMLSNMMKQKEGTLFHHVLNICINIAIVVPTMILVEKHGDTNESPSSILVGSVIDIIIGKDIEYSLRDAEQAFRFIGRIIAATYGHNHEIIEQSKKLLDPEFYGRFKNTIMPTLGEVFWILRRL